MICMICMHGAMARVGDRCHHHSSHPHTECREHLSSITSHTTHNTLQWTVYNNSHITQYTQIVLPPILLTPDSQCHNCVDLFKSRRAAKMQCSRTSRIDSRCCSQFADETQTEQLRRRSRTWTHVNTGTGL